MRANAALVSSLLMLAVGTVGCSSDESPAQSCIPGEQRACACPGGLQGAQLCSKDGSELGICSGCVAPAQGGMGGTAGSASRSSGGTSRNDFNIGGSQSAGGATPAASGGVGSTNSAAQGGASSSEAPSSGGMSGVGSGGIGGEGSLVESGGASNAGGGTPASGMSNGGAADTLGGATYAGGAAMGGLASGGVSGYESSTLLSTAGVAGFGGYVVASAGMPNAGRSATGGTHATGGQTQVAVCGDGLVQFSESCDPLPSNYELGDGCTTLCQAEPNCPSAGGACVTRCGDGLVAGSETCDDANVANGDGCSSLCQTESDYECSAAGLPKAIRLPMVVRDFDAGGDFEKGALFVTDPYYANQGLLEAALDANGRKPILKSTTGTYNDVIGKESGIASAASFAQWYDDSTVAAGNSQRARRASALALFRSGDAGSPAYVNRFGVNGDGLTDAQYLRTTATSFCGEVGKEDHDAQGNPIPCTFCPYDATPESPQCEQPQATDCQSDPSFIQCVAVGKQYHGVYVIAAFDGNPLFFPADSIPLGSPASTAQISGNFDSSWPSDPTGKLHNFAFTTEVRFWFKYDPAKHYELTFVGDDDVWVFVNKRLALDMGGIHTAVRGGLTIVDGTASANVTNTLPATKLVSITTAPALGTFESGGLYEVVIFQADRQTKASSYSLRLSEGFYSAPSVCVPK